MTETGHFFLKGLLMHRWVPTISAFNSPQCCTLVPKKAPKCWSSFRGNFHLTPLTQTEPLSTLKCGSSAKGDVYEFHCWARLAGVHGSCWAPLLWNALTGTVVYLCLSSGCWTWGGLHQKEPQEAGPEQCWPLAQLSACPALPGCPWSAALVLPRVKVQLGSLAPQPLVPRVGHAGSTYCSGAFEGHPSFGIIRLLPWCSGCRSCTIKGVLLYVQSLLAVICSFRLVSINERTNNSRD